MLILGIDPGTARLGIGVIEVTEGKKAKYIFATCLETSMDLSTGDRLWYLEQELSKIVTKYRPDVACVEQLFFGINARTAIAVGQARGVILSVLAQHKVPKVMEYQGLSVKVTLTGYGKSDKKQIQQSVKEHLGMKEIVKPDDAADGLALALCHFLRESGEMPVKLKLSFKANGDINGEMLKKLKKGKIQSRSKTGSSSKKVRK